MGHLMGLLDEPWLGIRPTGKVAMLRYAAFHKVENGKITETAMYFDIPHLMVQAGYQPFPPQTGAQLVQPGPMPHDALLFDMQPPEEGEKTLAAINYMATDLSTWKGGREEPLVDELRRSWHEDMLWWGPTGIARPIRSNAMPSILARFEKRFKHGNLMAIYAAWQKAIMAAFRLAKPDA